MSSVSRGEVELYVKHLNKKQGVVATTSVNERGFIEHVVVRNCPATGSFILNPAEALDRLRPFYEKDTIRPTIHGRSDKAVDFYYSQDQLNAYGGPSALLRKMMSQNRLMKGDLIITHSNWDNDRDPYSGNIEFWAIENYPVPVNGMDQLLSYEFSHQEPGNSDLMEYTLSR